MNEGLLNRLASKIGEAHLRSICLALNKKVGGINQAGDGITVNMLECVDYGVRNPVSLASIADVLKISHK